MAAVAYYRQGLDGEAATDLDEIDGATLNDGDFAFVMTGTTFYNYRLDDSSGASQSLPNVVTPSGTAGSKRWILQSVQNVQSPEYSNLTTSSTLAVGYSYNDSSGTNTHTLPLLSTTSAGEKIKVYITGTDRTVIINHNASDSSGAEIWTGVAVGDFVEFVSSGTAWLVEAHYESHYCKVYMSSDDTAGQGTIEQMRTFAEDVDVGNIFSTTTDAVLAPFDCYAEIVWQLISAQSVAATCKINTTLIKDYTVVESGGNSGFGQTFSGRYQLDAAQSLTFWAHSTDNDAGTQTIGGDATGDESQATVKLTRRYS